MIIQSQQKVGFMGLYFGLETLLGLCQMLLVDVPPTLTKITPFVSYRPSQDHLELFFSVLRSRNGFNPNPSCRLFISVFKGILMQIENKIDSGNCSILKEKVLNKCKFKISRLNSFTDFFSSKLYLN